MARRRGWALSGPAEIVEQHGRAVRRKPERAGKPPLLPRIRPCPAAASIGWLLASLQTKGCALFKIRHASALAVTALALLVAGCQKEEEKAPDAAAVEAGVCKREAAEALAGKDRISDEEAMRLTGATIVRQIKPGDGVTMDLRQERVTIETDPATGKIVRAFCG